MSIHVPKAAIVKVLEAPEASKLTAEQRSFLTTVSGHYSPNVVVLHEFTTVEMLQLLLPACEAIGERAHVAVMKTVLAAHLAGTTKNTKIGNLNALPSLIYQWLRADLMSGYVFKATSDGKYNPYLLLDAHYTPADRTHKTNAFVTVSFIANRGTGEDTFSLHFEHRQLAGETVDSLFARHGLVHETEELHAAFQKSTERCNELIANTGQQYRLHGSGMQPDRYSRAVSYAEYGKEGVKAVNAFDQLESRTSSRDGRTREIALVGWLAAKDTDGTPVPRHPYLCTFNLSTHEFEYVHVDNVTVYEYDTDIVKNLVLPPEHHDLIEALLETAGEQSPDFIENKNAGTTIVALGPPGCGKTLSAETYAESTKKPLYRVHSGQLGTKAEELETNLKKVLARATVWQCVTLIDEADVFIRKRGDDMDHNAVVSVFLRVLEYHTGVLFLTSNRADDIDDALLSRAMAVIRYKKPGAPELKRLWTQTAARMKAPLDEQQIAALVTQFPDISGRDLVLLFGLVHRYAKRRRKPMVPDLFRFCAQFRGLV